MKTTLTSRYPETAETLISFDAFTEAEIDSTLEKVKAASPSWAATSTHERCQLLHRVANLIRTRKDNLAQVITQEMGKLIGEAHNELEKCAKVCDYYAEHGSDFLSPEIFPTEASKSYVVYQPLGTILAIMPWNFPFWQVFRFAAPTLVGGNTAVLKHASNVPQCALAIQQLFHDAGFPSDVFSVLLISAEQVARVIKDPRIHAVTLTGSEAAGKAVASQAGAVLKKSILELGGSDAFIVLEDAGIEETAKKAATARFLNAGQVCSSAKRLIVVDSIADQFAEALTAQIQTLVNGDPMDKATTLAPLSRADIRDDVHHQVKQGLTQGAKCLIGGTMPDTQGWHYPATLIDHVTPNTVLDQEEVFGPVACITRVKDSNAAIQVANNSRYGLCGSVWTADIARGEKVARQIQAGSLFVNAIAKSDPRLPFGGIKSSGYGRELSYHGMREFLYAQAFWMD